MNSAFVGDTWRFSQADVSADGVLLTDTTPGVGVMVLVTLDNQPWGGPFVPLYEADEHRWTFALDLPGPGKVALIWLFTYGLLTKTFTQSVASQPRPHSVTVVGQSNLSWDAGPTGPLGPLGPTGPTGFTGPTGPPGIYGIEFLTTSVNWNAMPAALTAFNGSTTLFVIGADLSAFTQFRLIAQRSTPTLAGVTLRLESPGPVDFAAVAAAGDVVCPTANTLFFGPWATLAATAKGSSQAVALYGLGGDGVTNIIFARVRAEFR